MQIILHFLYFFATKILQKNERRKGFPLYALISHKLMSEGMNELTSERMNSRLVSLEYRHLRYCV